MHRFSSRQWVPFPIAQVFAFFAEPTNLPRLMPPALDTRIESAPSGLPRPGAEIAISFRPLPLLPLRLGWVAHFVEFEAGSHFVDEQRKGPFAYFCHRHGFSAETQNGKDGTVISDEIEFKLPLGAIGSVAVPLVRLQLAMAFAARRRRLPKLLVNG